MGSRKEVPNGGAQSHDVEPVSSGMEAETESHAESQGEPDEVVGSHGATS